jgi:hypothetical protein
MSSKALSSADPATTPTEEIAKDATSSATTEDVPEDTEDVLDIGEPRALSDPGQPAMTMCIVDLPLLGVSEYIVGFRSLFELAFGLGIARVLVWMMLEGQLAVGLLDHIFRGIPGYPEDIVVIPR